MFKLKGICYQKVCGATGIVCISFFSQISFGEHFVVLGSYQDRKIAVDELRKLNQRLDPLLISVRELDDGPYYRVLAGPFASFRHAQQRGEVWLDQGVKDAWIVQMPMPSQSDPVLDELISETKREEIASLQQ